MFGLKVSVGALLIFVAFACNVVMANSNPLESRSKLATRQTTPPPTLAPATWITTTNSSTNGSNLPAASSAYRIELNPPIVSPTVNISVAISVDNAYNLYFNGKLIGSGLDWTTPQQWDIHNANGTGPFVFAILATNFGAPSSDNPTAAIAGFQFSNGFSSFTGSGWKGVAPVPIGFEQVGFNDSAWPSANLVGPYGIGPWGPLPVPVNSTLCQT